MSKENNGVRELFPKPNIGGNEEQRILADVEIEEAKTYIGRFAIK